MILRSVKYLGDTIHSYFIVKKLNLLGIESKLYTRSEWRFLFDPYFLTDDNHNVFSVDGETHRLPHLNGRHARDRILHVFTDASQTAPSSSLSIIGEPSNLVTLCPRSSKNFKNWNGDWGFVESNLIKSGFDVTYDTPCKSLEELVINIASSKFIISVDTACVHIADAYNIPVIGLYGVTSLKNFGPYGDKSFCIQKRTVQDIKPVEIVMQIENIKRKILSQG